jgi:acetyltransferase-like isoleucine patch superfamily enzyme
MCSELWHNRSRPRLLTTAWARAWARRCVTFPRLVGYSWRSFNLRRRGAHLGLAVYISPGNIYGTLQKLSVGDYSFIGRTTIQLHENVWIGKCVCINDQVSIYTATHALRDPNWSTIAKPVTIEEYSWIASGATILPGVRVGRGAVVGASAVVARDVPDYSLAIGNPAKIIPNKRCASFDYTPVAFLASRAAWIQRPA